MECQSESCAFHTCPPENHFEWKQAGGAKYLRLKYQDNTDNDPQKIRAIERSRGNTISYMESWRASRALRARAAITDTDAAEAPVEGGPAEGAPTHAIMGMDGIDSLIKCSVLASPTGRYAGDRENLWR